MIEQHEFVIGLTCYWHHEHEVCVRCGQPDKPDDPRKPFHLPHDEGLDRLRRLIHPEHHERERWAREAGLR